MSCKQAQVLIHRYAEGALAAEQAQRVGHHLVECKPCKARYSALSSVYNLIEQDRADWAHRPELAELVWQQAMEGVGKRLGSIAPIRAMAIALTAAAGIALGVALGSLASLGEGGIWFNGQWEGLAADYFLLDSPLKPYEILANVNYQEDYP